MRRKNKSDIDIKKLPISTFLERKENLEVFEKIIIKAIDNFKAKYNYRNPFEKYDSQNLKSRLKAISMNFGTSRIFLLFIKHKYGERNNPFKRFTLKEFANLEVFVDDRLSDYEFRLLY